jgi:hypothetical protein
VCDRAVGVTAPSPRWLGLIAAYSRRGRCWLVRPVRFSRPLLRMRCRRPWWRPGQVVSFRVGRDDRGRAAAIDVRRESPRARPSWGID